MSQAMADLGFKAAFTVRVLRACRRAGVLFTLPSLSKPWDWPPLVAELRRAGAWRIRFAQCAYGAPYRKFTDLAASHPSFEWVAAPCCGRKHTEVLRGLVHVGGRWVWKTSLAAAYPPRFGRAYAEAAVAAAPLAAYRGPRALRLDPRWQSALAAARGRPRSKLVTVGRCPRCFVLPWRGAPSRWT